jgi:hypothetical protein
MRLSHLSKVLVGVATLVLFCGLQGVNAATVTKPTSKVKPLAKVTGLQATVQNDGVLLTWQPVTGCDGYRLYYDGGNTVGAAAYWIDISGQSQTSYLFTAVVKGQQYSFKVAALRSGVEGPASDPVTVTVPAAVVPLSSDVG